MSEGDKKYNIWLPIMLNTFREFKFLVWLKSNGQNGIRGFVSVQHRVHREIIEHNEIALKVSKNIII